MKKTMFITSVIMVVVMAIALTTSSLAWFSAASQGSTVSTQNLTVTASAGTTTSGIKITDDLAEATLMWYDNISLAPSDVPASNNVVTGLKPLLPYQYSDGSSTSITTLLGALSANTFINGEVKANDFFNAAGVDAVSGEYFANQNIYITNIAQASGSQGAAVYIGATITFKKAGAAYNYLATANKKDANLVVAVLADTSERIEADGDERFDSTLNADPGPTWEIIALASSRNCTSTKNSFAGQDYLDATNAAYTVRFGKDASYFEADDSSKANACSDALTVSSVVGSTNTYTDGDNNYTKKLTSDAIAGITTDSTTGEVRDFGEVKQFKIIAWYDGITLVNSNSDTSLQFEVTFDAYDASKVS